MYKPYASESYYEGRNEGKLIPEDDQWKALIQASRHVDVLTFNRIVGRGFSSLTEYQQEIIREVVCQQADFETENADMIASVLSSYSINGVSMQFGSAWNVFTDKGVAMRRDTYALLCQTGLCCRLAR
nr:MAG TPA: Head Tail Connector Protein [Caudoviricetes sp.]